VVWEFDRFGLGEGCATVLTLASIFSDRRFIRHIILDNLDPIRETWDEHCDE
jgi:hypothetical protein